MKKSFKIIDNINKTIIEKEIKIRDREYFNSLLVNKAKVYKDKTKYSRKEKYKNKEN